MKKLYNKAKNDLWVEQNVCMSVIARYGTGGGNMPVVLQNNQNNATVGDTEVCPTLPAAMGNGGGYVPMIVEPICFRPEQTIKVDGGGVAFTLESREFKAPRCVAVRELGQCLSCKDDSQK